MLQLAQGKTPCYRDMRVAVIGGGLAGAMAAFSLTVDRVPVTLFEASSRVGGRVQSLHSLIPGRVVEAGAELIGANHRMWQYLARRFGLTLVPVSGEDHYKRKCQRVRLRFGMTDISDADKERMRADLEPRLARIGEDARAISAAAPWTAPNAAALDARSVADRLSDRDMFGATSSLARAYLELILGNDLCTPPSRQSYLALLAAVSAGRMGDDMLGYWRFTETHRCAGGNEQLVRRLAQPLRDVRLQTPVVGIAIGEDGVLVTSGRHQRSERFDYVILAAPRAGWPTITSSPAFRPADFTVSQGPAVKYLTGFDDARWMPRRLAPSALWDDLGSVWESTDRQTGPGGFGLSVYSGGTFVRTAAQYHAGLETLFPGFSRNVKSAMLVDWPRRDWIRTGYSCPAPGEVTTVARRLNAGFLGRLYFAGEHTSPGFFGYMEGALESGLRAAGRVARARHQECSRRTAAMAGVR